MCYIFYVHIIILCAWRIRELFDRFSAELWLNYSGNIAVGPSLVCTQVRICPRGRYHLPFRNSRQFATRCAEYHFEDFLRQTRKRPRSWTWRMELSSTLEFASASRRRKRPRRLSGLATRRLRLFNRACLETLSAVRIGPGRGKWTIAVEESSRSRDCDL